jgi:N-acetylneuraminic acid mutarotase
MVKLKISLSIIFILVAGIQAQWRYGPVMPTARYGMAAVVVDEMIYVIGGAEAGRNGLSTVEVFNPATGFWTENVSEINNARIYAAAAVFEGQIFLFGGTNKNQLIPQVEMYEPGTDRWNYTSSMPTPREGLCTVVVDSSIWIIGGNSSDQERVRMVERYYPRSNRWDTLAYPLNKGRVGAVAAAYNDELYIFGGHFVEPLDSYEKFVPGQGWTITDGGMLYACGSAAGISTGDKVWLAGGQGQGNSGILNRVQSYSMNGDGHWQEETALKTGRKNLALVEVNNTLYAIGGNSGKSTQTASNIVEVLDLVTTISEKQNFTDAGPLKLAPNYPNPFNNMTIIRVYMPASTYTTINIYNMLGEKVRQLHAGSISGWRQFQFDARDEDGKILPSGQYFLYLTTANEKLVQKIILAK